MPPTLPHHHPPLHSCINPNFPQPRLPSLRSPTPERLIAHTRSQTQVPRERPSAARTLVHWVHANKARSDLKPEELGGWECAGAEQESCDRRCSAKLLQYWTVSHGVSIDRGYGMKRSDSGNRTSCRKPYFQTLDTCCDTRKTSSTPASTEPALAPPSRHKHCPASRARNDAAKRCSRVCSLTDRMRYSFAGH